MQAQDHFLNNLNYFHNLVIKVSQRVLRADTYMKIVNENSEII